MKRIISLILVLLPVFAYAEKIVLGSAIYTEGNSTEKVLKNIMFHFEEDSYDFMTDKNNPYIGFFWSDDGGDVNNAKNLNSIIVTKGSGRFVKMEDGEFVGYPASYYGMIIDGRYIIIELCLIRIMIAEVVADNSGVINENNITWSIRAYNDDLSDVFSKLKKLLDKASSVIN